MAVAYSEKDVQESSDAETLTATRMLHCKWDDRYALRAELFNQPFPHNPVNNFLARTFQFRGIGATKEATPGNSTLLRYEEALVEVGYELVQGESADPGNPDGNNPMQMTFFEEAYEESLEFLTMSGQQLYWFKAPEPGKSWPKVPEGSYPSIPVVSTDWRLTYYNVLNVPDFDGIVGYINDSAVVSQTLGRTFQAYTLFLHPPTLTRSVSTTSNAWTMNVTFTHRPQTWNKFYWPDYERYTGWDAGVVAGNPWYPIANKAAPSGKVFFQPADFTPILPPAPVPPGP